MVSTQSVNQQGYTIRLLPGSRDVIVDDQYVTIGQL
jgi:hypothetical protein